MASEYSAPLTTDQLKDLLAKVTPGEWRVEQETTLVWGACNPGDNSSSGMGYPIAEARITPISISSWARGPDEDAGEANATLIALAPTLAAEVVRLRAIIEKVDQYSPVADETCDEPGITFTEAIIRQWPELRQPSP